MKLDYKKITTGSKMQNSLDSSKIEIPGAKSDRYNNLLNTIGINTLEADLKSTADVLNRVQSGWHSSAAMAAAKDKATGIQERLKAYEEFRNIYAPDSPQNNELISGYNDILSGWDERANEYAKYENKEDYDKAVKEYEAYQDSLVADIGELDAEINSLKPVVAEAEHLAFMVQSAQNGSQYSPNYYNNIKSAQDNLNKHLTENGYSSLEELKATLNNKQIYRNNAKNNQALEEIKKPIVSAGDFDTKSLYVEPSGETTNGGRQDFLKNIYGYINGNGKGSDTTTKALPIYDESGKIVYGENNFYSNLKEDEIKTFNYLYNSGKTQEAKEYLGKLRNTLETRDAFNFFEENLKDKPVLEVLYGFGAGVDQWAQGLTNVFNTKDDYIEPSYAQKVGGYITEDMGDVGDFFYNTTTTIGNMAPSILASYLTGGVASSLGAGTKAVGIASKVAGAGTMGLSAAGNAYAQAINMGWEKPNARMYSALVGISEAGLSYAFSGISKLGGAATGKSITAIASGIDNGLLRVAAKVGLKASSEAFEEMAQEALNPLFENIALGYNKNGFSDIDWSEVVNAGLMALVTTGFFEGVPTVLETKAESKTFKEAKHNFPDSESQGYLIGEGIDLGGEAKQLAEQLKAKLDKGKTLKGSQISQLIEANKEAIAKGDTAKIKAAVENRLKKLGETANVSTVADIVTKQAVGEDLTRTERKNLADSKYGERVANEANPKNVMSGDYSSYWAQLIETDIVNAEAYNKKAEIGTETNGLNRLEQRILETNDEDLSVGEKGLKQRILSNMVERKTQAANKQAFGRSGAVPNGNISTDVSLPSQDTQTDALTFEDEQLINTPDDELSDGGKIQKYNLLQKIREQENISEDKNTATQGENILASPEGEEAVDTKGLGFTEPSEKEIRRPLTYEEQIDEILGRKKTVQMRHIDDLAKKLDKDLKVLWVDPTDNRLSGNNGVYIRDTNTMLLSNKLSTIEGYAEVFKHEYVHRLETKKAYQGFKNYLFNKSKAFEEYAISRLQLRDGKIRDNRDDAINDLVSMYIDNFKNNKAIPQNIRDNFTKEKAEKEAVADFIARTLFKGNTAQLRVALTTDTAALQAIKTDLKLFEELAKDDRNLFQKIIDAIKDFIARIKGIPQFRQLEEDLAYIEQRLSRVYNSRDIKNTATDSGVVYENAEFVSDEINTQESYKEPITLEDIETLRSIGRKSINNFTQEDLSKASKWAYKFYEQLGEKSPFFRAWFGDWRANEKGTVKLIKTAGSVRKPSVKNVDTGWDIIVSRQVSKETNHHSGDNEKSAIKYLPYIIDITENAVLFNTEVSDKENNLSAMFHSLYAYTEIMGYPALLKLQVEELVNEKDGSPIYRDYILQNIEEEPISLGKRFSKAHHHETDSSNISISDLFVLVKQYDKSFTPKPSSAIVDKNGKPLVVYHGTDADFSVFDTGKQRTSGKLNFGKGIYLTPNKNLAEMYSNTGKTMKLYAVVKKPYEFFSTRLDDGDLQKLSNEFGEEVTLDNINEVLQKHNYDGIIARTYNGTTNPINQIVVFENTQVKAAEGNIGTFDKENADIYFSSDDLTLTHRDLLDRYEQGEITKDEYLAEMDGLYGQAVEQYGAIEKGEYNETDMPVPQAVAEDKPTERFARTFVGAAKLTPEMANEFEKDVLLGKFSYKVASDDKAIETAKKVVSEGEGEKVWESLLNKGGFPTKNDIAIGEKLLTDAIDEGDTLKTMQLASELADIFTRAGQVVQAARLLGKMTGAGRLVSAQRFVDSLNTDIRKKNGVDARTIKIDPKLAELLATAEGQRAIEQAYSEIMKNVAEQMPPTFLDKWNAWRYFAMLSNPRTHVRNLVGNTIFIPSVRLKDTIAAGLEKAIKVENGTKVVKVKKEYRDFAKNDVKKKETQALIKGGKYDDAKNEVNKNRKTFETKWLEGTTSFVFNALETEDMWFKNIHYVHALGSFLQARKVDLSNVGEEVLTEARAYAIREAKKATFNDANELATAIQKLSDKNMFTKLAVEGILPFKRTPLNIIRRGVEYSPIGLVTSLTKGIYDVKKGKITASEFIDGAASGITGTILMGLGWLIASLGFASGGSDDEDKAWYEKLLGGQNYAITIGNHSYTIDWAAPSAIPFFMGVELSSLAEEGFSLGAVLDVMGSSLEPLINLSALQGVQDAINSARYANVSKLLTSMLFNTVQSYTMQNIPSFVGAIARTADSKQRSWYVDKNSDVPKFAQDLWNEFRSKIPGLTQTMPEKIDAWGREVSRGSVGERIAENFISPGYYSEKNYTDVDRELERLYNKTKEASILPKTAPKYFSVDGKKKDLTADEYVTFAKAKGQYSFEYVEEFINHKEYDSLTDEQKAAVISNLYEYAGAKAKTTVSSYDLMKTYKVVTLRERNGGSAVDYYIKNQKKK